MTPSPTDPDRAQRIRLALEQREARELARREKQRSQKPGRTAADHKPML